MSNVDNVARDFTAMLRAGECQAAAHRFRAPDILCIEPNVRDARAGAGVDDPNAINIVYQADRIDDLCVDGPFVTGNQFALFLDMMIVDHDSGHARPFNEIALYTVDGAKITEERYFYD